MLLHQKIMNTDKLSTKMDSMTSLEIPLLYQNVNFLHDWANHRNVLLFVEWGVVQHQQILSKSLVISKEKAWGNMLCGCLWKQVGLIDGHVITEVPVELIH